MCYYTTSCAQKNHSKFATNRQQIEQVEFGLYCAGWPEFAYDRLQLNDVKDVTFFPSRETRSYDAFVATSDDVLTTVLRLELDTGEMDVVYGTLSTYRPIRYDIALSVSHYRTAVRIKTYFW